MSWALAGTVITQSGTDTSLSGLAGISGVATQVSGIRTIYVITGRTIVITGSLTFDAKAQGIDLSIVGPIQAGFAVNAGAALIINSVINGKPTYDDAITTRVTSGAQTEIRINTGATFTLTGGRISLTGNGSSASAAFLLDKGATVTITDGWIRSNYNQTRWGEFGTGNLLAYNVNRLICQGMNFTMFGVFGSLSGLSPFNTGVQIVAYSAFTNITLSDFNPLDSAATCDNWDVINAYLNNPLSTAVTLTSGNSSGGPGSNRWITVRKYLNVTARTPAGAAIPGAVVYVRDTNNGARVDVLNIANQLSDNVYIQSTSGAGVTPDFFLYVMHGKSAPSGVSQPVVRDYCSKTAVAGADLFDLHIWSYANVYRLLNDTAAKGLGVLPISTALLADTNVTLAESAAVAKLASSFTVVGNTLTVVADSTLDGLYDAMKAYKTRPIQTQLEYPSIGVQPVTSDGLTASTAMTIVVDNCILSAGARHNGLVTSSTISFVNGGAPSATLVYQDSTGTSVPVTVACRNGSKVRVVRTDTSAELAIGSAGASGFVARLSWTTDLPIRADVAYAVGLDAEQEASASGTLTNLGASLTVTQVPCTVYETNAIDGATITGLTLDDINIEADADELDNELTCPEFFAWYKVQLMTDNGIRSIFRAVDAINARSYTVDVAIADLHIHNIDVVNTLMITGGVLRRSDGTSIRKAGPTTTHGSIEMTPEDVYAIETGASGLTLGQFIALK